MKTRLFNIFFMLCIVCAATLRVHAIDLTSTNFIIKGPVIGTGSGFGSSTSFDFLSSMHTNFSGTGSSATFIGRYGFLYFPYLEEDFFTAVANGDDADLTWGPTTAGLGWNVDGYNTGIAGVSGGPYTFTDVGNVTSYTYSNLAPGDYCFILQTYDVLGYVIATSDEDCITIQQTITFDLDTGIVDGETSPTYSVSLGALSVSNVRVSGSTDSVNMIIAEMDTNAPGGILVQIRNGNGNSGLVSTSTPGNNVNSADGTMSAGTENYGLCVISVAQSAGTLSKASPYNSGSCATNSETNSIQGLTTTGENMLTSGGAAVSGGHAEIAVQGAVSGTTPAHSDYTDTLTFTITGTF